MRWVQSGEDDLTHGPAHPTHGRDSRPPTHHTEGSPGLPAASSVLEMTCQTVCVAARPLQVVAGGWPAHGNHARRTRQVGAAPARLRLNWAGLGGMLGSFEPVCQQPQS